MSGFPDIPVLLQAQAEAKDIIEGIGGNPPKLMITGSFPAVSTYQIKIFYYYDNGEDPGGASLTVEKIGIWLPPDFDYDGNCSLADDPDTQPYSAPGVDDYCSGKAVVWNFASVPLTNFSWWFWPPDGEELHLPVHRSGGAKSRGCPFLDRDQWRLYLGCRYHGL